MAKANEMKRNRISGGHKVINLKLPPGIEFHQDIRLLIYRPRGVIDETAVNKIIAVIEEIEAATQEPFDRFTDASGAHEVELNFRYVIQISLHRRLAHTGRVPVKSAILATDVAIVHYARLLVLLTEGSSIKVRVFADCEDAAQWLGVSIGLLAPGKTLDGQDSATT
ncbi:MAG TPA: hypothetical protein VFC63_10870 [Blastocatellia bacterium]|nr:hypothetical protein [Blastocatellia bacterium]